MNFQPNTELEQIRVSEKSKRLLSGRFSYVVISPTEQKINNRKLQSLQVMIDKEIDTSPIRKLFFALAIIFLAVVILKIFTTPLNHDLIARILVFVAFTIVIIYLLNIGFISSKYNYSFFFNFEGLYIGEEYYRWTELKQTAILQIGSGRGQREHLVLVFKNGSYKKYPLEGFLSLSGPGTMISTYIEYFKNNTVT
jgi:hypothetical protein